MQMSGDAAHDGGVVLKAYIAQIRPPAQKIGVGIFDLPDLPAGVLKLGPGVRQLGFGVGDGGLKLRPGVLKLG